MQALPPAEMMQHIDEFLLPVGPATGKLMNILIKEAKAKTILEIELARILDGTGWPRRRVRLAVKSSRLDVHAGKQE